MSRPSEYLSVPYSPPDPRGSGGAEMAAKLYDQAPLEPDVEERFRLLKLGNEERAAETHDLLVKLSELGNRATATKDTVDVIVKAMAERQTENEALRQSVDSLLSISQDTRAGLKDAFAQLALLTENPPPTGGWRYYFTVALTSRRFQTAAAAVVAVLAALFSGRVDEGAALLTLFGIVSGYLTSEAYTDGARAKAEAQKATATASLVR